MLITVMHHIPDPESVIREALRVTRKKVIVVEDIYNHQLGKLWTEWRDRFFNFEYVGHPCQFKSAKEWKNLFSALGCQVEHEKHVYTWLSGLRILNGIFIFNR